MTIAGSLVAQRQRTQVLRKWPTAREASGGLMPIFIGGTLRA